ncbi:hypothetical protein [Nocardia sp. NBC_00511]|uniref:hypothetical protein n=1 Tax=Nocardia sp. NBC_00511 TaxID=2903591 RepID=UPI0030E57560
MTADDPKLDGLTAQVDAVYKMADDMISFFDGGKELGTWPITFKNPLHAYLIGDDEDSVKDHIKKAISGDQSTGQPGIRPFLVGAKLPQTLIDIAGTWRSAIGTPLANAVTDYNDTNLSGHWSGPAHDIYNAQRVDKQKPALDAMVKYTTDAAGCLESVATSVESLYANLAKNITDMIAAVAYSVSKQLSPTAVVSLMSAYANTVIDLCKAIVKAIIDILETSTKVSVQSGILKALTDVPTGMPNGHWPDAQGQGTDAATRNELVTALGGITMDGGSVSWKIPTDRA